MSGHGGTAGSFDDKTTPIGARTTCPQCGVQLDAFTTTCGACGAVVTGGTMDAGRMERVRARLQDGVGAGYRLGGMLGRGGMGIVFQAREVSLDRDVALKVLAFDPILNPEAFERFEREAKLAARLDHPNIVPIFSVGQGNGIAFYTMRMVRGGSVESLVSGGRSLDLPRTLAILADVASALDYAHAQGVVHRDIKPANILLGESGHVLVADFGIARAFSGPASSGATGTGTGVVGSPAYMSPEQWRGEKVDGRADQYALGVLAFELLTGTRPFTGDSMQELLRMHLQDDAPDIISVRHDLPAHLSEPIRRAMNKLPAERFPSAGAFVQALGGQGAAASRNAGAPDAAATVRAPISASTGVTSQAGPVVADQRRTQARPPAPVRAKEKPSPASVAADERPSRSVMPWLVLLLIAGVGAAVIWKLAPTGSGGDVAPATATAPPADSLTDREKQFQAQIDEARRIALAAEHRADSLAAAGRAATGTAPSGAAGRETDTPHSHLYVFAQGGTPTIYVDGVSQNTAAPALVQVTPGRHTIQVRGVNAFEPSDTTIVLAPEDTQTVVFRVERPAGARPGGDARGRAGTVVAPNWEEWTQKLGFDPRTTDLRRLTPEQRQRYRRFQQAIDSLRRLGGRRP